MSEAALARVDEILSRPRLEPAQSTTVFVPLGGSYLFLWRTAQFRYADVRRIDNTIGARQIEAMRASRRPFSQGFPQHLCRPHREGRILLGDGQQVLALMLVEYDFRHVPSLAGQLCRFMWPWLWEAPR